MGFTPLKTTLKTITLLALALVAPLALADPPARMGRISSAEGQVTLQGGGDAAAAALNWPVTTGNRITTAPGARAEFRVGASAVRLDGDSELEVSQLDDDNFKLRLNYGSVGVRIRDADLVNGFELSTEQARVSLAQPGWLRVDAARAPDSSVVSVFDGAAEVKVEVEVEVEGGARLTVRAGQRVEVRDDDIVGAPLRRDAFDDWPEAPAAPQALRYVGAEVTAYEELDRYGNWRDDPDYGPLWSPRSLPADWVPYRDGSWVWIEPWGWTWVDNAPWAYAPSHYGRWVLLGRRWCWAPGRERAHPAWAPALVGWVGGDRWRAGGARSTPALGWFPLAPHERYLPPYRVTPDYARRVNTNNGARWERAQARRAGVTVLPYARFESRRTVAVNKTASVALAPGALKSAPPAMAPVPFVRLSPPDGQWTGADTARAWTRREAPVQIDTPRFQRAQPEARFATPGARPEARFGNPGAQPEVRFGNPGARRTPPGTRFAVPGAAPVEPYRYPRAAVPPRAGLPAPVVAAPARPAPVPFAQGPAHAPHPPPVGRQEPRRDEARGRGGRQERESR